MPVATYYSVSLVIKKCLLFKSLGCAHVVVHFFQMPHQQLCCAQAACWFFLLASVMFSFVLHSNAPLDAHACRFNKLLFGVFV